MYLRMAIESPLLLAVEAIQKVSLPGPASVYTSEINALLIGVEIMEN